MNDTRHTRPAIRRILEILNEAGEQGILATDVARHFTTANPRDTLPQVNILLSRTKYDGRAVRSGARLMPAGSTDRRTRSYRWWITELGVLYLTPPVRPVITVIDEPPNPKRIMEILKEAGEEGMRGSDIARHFTIGTPATPSLVHLTDTSKNLQRRMAWVNQILDRYEMNGRVRRGDLEPSPWYHRTPAYRWYITPDGVDYLAAGLAEGIRASRAARNERERADKAARRKLREDLLTQAYIDCDPETVTICQRERVVRELRAAGCTLDSIGQVFGITRERVRQILVNVRPSTCRCPDCAEDAWARESLGDAP